MESWTCDSEESDFDLPFGIFQPSNTAEAVLELGNTSNHGSHILTKSQSVFRNQLSMRSDFSCAREKATSDDYIGKLLDGMDAHSHEVSQKTSREESSSKDSSSIIDTNVQESSFIDLKLGMFSDPEEARSNTMKEKAFPSPAPRIRSKRARTSLSSHNLVCQVHGCNADLTAAKDYHKKHKVCDAHCKTANVVVNGKTQRFCQQCSRFHMLKEFDGTKRSCRRRLAAHNERRRKPHVDIRSRSLELMNQHYLGGKFHGTTTLPTRMSFFCRNAFPFDSPPHNEKYLNINWTGDAKLGQHLIRDNAQKCINVTRVVERPYVSTSATKLVSENTCHPYGNQRELRLASHNSLSHGVPSRHGFPVTSSSVCALYLLSNQLEGSSTYPSETPAVQHLPFLGSYPPHSEAPVYHRMGGFESHGLSNVASNALCSSGFKAMASEHVGLPDFGANVATTFNMEDQYNSAVPAQVASGNVICDARGNTAGLLQLSSPFMSSEPRPSVQVKQDGMHALQLASIAKLERQTNHLRSLNLS